MIDRGEGSAGYVVCGWTCPVGCNSRDLGVVARSRTHPATGRHTI